MLNRDSNNQTNGRANSEQILTRYIFIHLRRHNIHKGKKHRPNFFHRWPPNGNPTSKSYWCYIYIASTNNSQISKLYIVIAGSAHLTIHNIHYAPFVYRRPTVQMPFFICSYFFPRFHQIVDAFFRHQPSQEQNVFP